MTKKFQLSRQLLVKILNFCEKKGRFFLTFGKGEITINCPKFKAICDEWSMRKLKENSGVTRESLGSNYEINKNKNKNKNKEKDKEKRKKKKDLSPSGIPSSPPTEPEAEGENAEFFITKKGKRLEGKRLEGFNLFWGSWNFETPYPKNKKEAADAWLEIPSLTGKLVNEICEAAKAMGRNRVLKKTERDSTPIHPAPWIRASRWIDYFEEKKFAAALPPPPEPVIDPKMEARIERERERLRQEREQNGNLLTAQ